jgi:uncharacterized membrane protein
VDAAEVAEPAKMAAASGPPKWQPSYGESALFAMLAGCFYGSSPILVRSALDLAGHDSSIAGGLVSYTAATLAILLVIAVTGQIGHVLATRRSALGWFLLAAILVGLSQMFRYLALAFAPVSVVQPIQRLSNLFRMYFSSLLSRDYEILDDKIIVGSVISLVGALLLSLSIDSMLSALPLPAAIADFARLQFP